jgi:hypothetical protein
MSNLTNSLVTAGHKIAVDAITKCAEKYNFDAADAVHWYQSTYMNSSYCAPTETTETTVAGKKKSTATGGGRPKKAKTIELPNSTSESNIFRALAEQASVAANDDEAVAYSPEQAAAPPKKIAAKKTKTPVEKAPVDEDKLQKYRDIAAKVVRDAAQPTPVAAEQVAQVEEIQLPTRYVIEEVEEVQQLVEQVASLEIAAPVVEVVVEKKVVVEKVVEQVAVVVEAKPPTKKEPAEKKELAAEKKEKATGGGSTGGGGAARKEFKIRRNSPTGEMTTYRISPEFLVYTKDERELVGKYEGEYEDKNKKGRIIFNTADDDSDELQSESEGEAECDDL